MIANKDGVSVDEVAARGIDDLALRLAYLSRRAEAAKGA